MLAHGPCSSASRAARDGTLDVLGTGLGDRRDLAPAGGVERGERGAVGRVEALAADQQLLRTGEELARSGPERVGEGGCVGSGCHGGSL